MAIINLEYLKPGMVLNNDVKDINGRLLMTAGTEIAEKHLHILKAWGITEVDIKGITEKEVEDLTKKDIDPFIFEQAENELNEIFIYTDKTHPAIREIFRLCAIRKAKNAEYKINQNS
ncbi:MAG: hypothetical protein ACPL1G_03040 [Thermodesulfovibrionales bacterium]